MRKTRFSEIKGFWDTPMLPFVPVDTMPSEFRAGYKYGLQSAAAVCRNHILMLARRHGDNSPEVYAAELDLYCFDRALRRFKF